MSCAWKRVFVGSVTIEDIGTAGGVSGLVGEYDGEEYVYLYGCWITKAAYDTIVEDAELIANLDLIPDFEIAGTGTLPDPATIDYGLGWVDDGVLYVNVNGTWVIASDLGLISGDEWDSVVVDGNEIVTDGGVAVIDT